jgi:transcriptional regulator with XRE-family HTH domain
VHNSEQEGIAAEDQRIGAQCRKAREHAGLGQAELAVLMRDAGYPFTQQMIGKIEQGARSLRLKEAEALARITKVPLVTLTRPPAIAVHAWALWDSTRRARLSHEELLSAMSALARNRAELEAALKKALKLDEGDLAPEIATARRVLATTGKRIEEDEYGRAYTRGQRGLVDLEDPGQGRLLPRVRDDGSGRRQAGPEAPQAQGPESPEGGSERARAQA